MRRLLLVSLAVVAAQGPPPPSPATQSSCCVWPRAVALNNNCIQCTSFSEPGNWLSNSSANCLSPINQATDPTLQYTWCPIPPSAADGWSCCTWPRPLPSCSSCLAFAPSNNWLSASAGNCESSVNLQQYRWCKITSPPPPPSPPPARPPPPPPPNAHCCTWPQNLTASQCVTCTSFAPLTNWLSESQASCESPANPYRYAWCPMLPYPLRPPPPSVRRDLLQ